MKVVLYAKVLTGAVASLWAPGRWKACTWFSCHTVWSASGLDHAHMWLRWSTSGLWLHSSTLWTVPQVYTDDMLPWVSTVYKIPLSTSQMQLLQWTLCVQLLWSPPSQSSSGRHCMCAETAGMHISWVACANTEACQSSHAANLISDTNLKICEAW